MPARIPQRESEFSGAIPCEFQSLVSGTTYSCRLPRGHGGPHDAALMPNRIPLHARSPTAVSGRSSLRPFLIETHIEGEGRPQFSNGLAITLIGAMCDEDSPATDLVVRVNGDVHRLDRRYLRRIWPTLFKLPTMIAVDRGDALVFEFPGKAVVVIAGVLNANVEQ